MNPPSSPESTPARADAPTPPAPSETPTLPEPSDSGPSATPPLHHSTTPSSPRSRTGKIARLPAAIREQLNTRLQDGELVDDILEWLNALPEVQTILNEQFDACPISKSNVNRWKYGGYRDWQARQDALDMTGSLADEDSLGHKSLANPCDKLARWIAIQLAAATQNLDPEDPEATARLASLYQLAAGISRLRRDNLNADRIEIERQWLALEQANAEYLKEKQFWAWTERPDIREKLFPPEHEGLRPETLRKIERELNLL